MPMAKSTVKNRSFGLRLPKKATFRVQSDISSCSRVLVCAGTPGQTGGLGRTTGCKNAHFPITKGRDGLAHLSGLMSELDLCLARPRRQDRRTHRLTPDTPADFFVRRQRISLCERPVARQAAVLRPPFRTRSWGEHLGREMIPSLEFCLPGSRPRGRWESEGLK